jgi:DNA-binding response OmpR family regulator
VSAVFRASILRSAPVSNTSHRSSCLIVEDQALIGMAIEAYLEDAGFEPAFVASGRQAMSWLENTTPACAILDYQLKDGSCTELARELRRRGVPFVVYSGHQRSVSVEIELQEVPWIEKPAARAELVDAITAVAVRSDRVR